MHRLTLIYAAAGLAAVGYHFHGLWRPMELIMPLVHPDLQTWRSRRVPGQRIANGLVLGTLLLATLNSPLAQDAGAPPSGKPNPLYPDEAEITFQWNYECPSNRPARLFVVEQEEEDQTT
jgi:hypothetical protein